MESFDSLVISLLDSDAMIGCFKKELASKLNIEVTAIGDVWLESEIIGGVVSQMLNVSFDAKITKELLMDLPFKYVYGNRIVFDVGDVVL